MVSIITSWHCLHCRGGNDLIVKNQCNLPSTPETANIIKILKYVVKKHPVRKTQQCPGDVLIAAIGACLVAQTIKNPPAMQETQVPSLVGKIPWRRKWLPTPVFLPGEFHEQSSLVGYSPWGHKELDTTKRLTLFTEDLALRPHFTAPLCWGLEQAAPRHTRMVYWLFWVKVTGERAGEGKLDIKTITLWPPPHSPKK